MTGTFDGNGYVPETVQAPPSDDTVSFFVPGTPVPQGSKTAFVVGKRAVVTDANRAKLKPWRATVADYADIARTFAGPVSVTLLFILPRPQRPRWDTPAVKPDIDKLARAALDGLTDGGLLEDDARVIDLNVKKRYSTFAVRVGMHVKVSAA